MEELHLRAQSHDLNPIVHLWDEMECRLRARPNCPTSVPHHTNALLAEWNQVPSAMFQHLVESLPRRVEAVMAAKGEQLHINGHNFGMRCYTSRCPHTFGRVVYNVWLILLKFVYDHMSLFCVGIVGNIFPKFKSLGDYFVVFLHSLCPTKMHKTNTIIKITNKLKTWGAK